MLTKRFELVGDEYDLAYFALKRYGAELATQMRRAGAKAAPELGEEIDRIEDLISLMALVTGTED